MALDFGVKNSIYEAAFEDLRKDRESDPLYWKKVEESIQEEAIKSSKSVESQKVDPDLMHRCFSL